MQPGFEDELLYGIGLVIVGLGIMASGVRHSHCKSDGVDWVITFTSLPFFYLAWFMLAQATGTDPRNNPALLFYSRFAIVLIGVLTVLHHLNGRVNEAIDLLLAKVVGWMRRK